MRELPPKSFPVARSFLRGHRFAWVRFRIEDRSGKTLAGPSADFHADEITDWNDKELRDVLTALTRAIRALVVDDHAMLRRGLCSFLTADPGFEVVGEAARGREALLKAAELQPNVIVLDINLPDIDGLEVTRRMRKIAPNSEILFWYLLLTYCCFLFTVRTAVTNSRAASDLSRYPQAPARKASFITAFPCSLTKKGLQDGENPLRYFGWRIDRPHGRSRCCRCVYSEYRMDPHRASFIRVNSETSSSQIA